MTKNFGLNGFVVQTLLLELILHFEDKTITVKRHFNRLIIIFENYLNFEVIVGLIDKNIVDIKNNKVGNTNFIVENSVNLETKPFVRVYLVLYLKVKVHDIVAKNVVVNLQIVIYNVNLVFGNVLVSKINQISGLNNIVSRVNL